ncbi:MAG: hypothetical protein ABIP48_23080, partial [Planctomycetota bacterium]
MSDLRQQTLQKPPLSPGSLSPDPVAGIELDAADGPQASVEPPDEDRTVIPNSNSKEPPPQRSSGVVPDYQLTAVKLSKSYRKGGVTIPVLRGVHLGVRRGE